MLHSVDDRIVVTGLGIYCSVARDAHEFQRALRTSAKGFRRITEFDVDGCRNDRAAMLSTIDPANTRCGLRGNIMLAHATEEALATAALGSNVDGSRVGVTVGTSLGGIAGYVDWLLDGGAERTDPADRHRQFANALNPDNRLRGEECIPNIPPQLLAYEVARSRGYSAAAVACVTACSAGANSIAIGADFLRRGRADAMVVTAVDALSPLTVMGFHSLMALTKAEPSPFDRDRTGLLIGEGAAALVLERDSDARARGATAFAELAGYGLSNDAYHVTQPHPDGVGASLAMRQALGDARIGADDIDYVNMHGTGTKYNDLMELAALHDVFGERAAELPISSIKGAIGHTLGAAGAVEAVASVLALHHRFLPPNANFRTSIDGVAYNVVESARAHDALRHVMSNSFAFGGNCASLVFRAYS